MIMSPAAGWGTASCACAASSATRSSWSPAFARGAGILRTSCRPQLRCLAHGRDRGLDQGRGDTSMPNRILRGRCLCGAIQYTVNGEPRWCAHCHCDDCRHHTGSAFATFIGVDSDSFTLSDGEFGRIESSAGVYRSFCAKCGTPMAYERNDLPNEIHLYVGYFGATSRYTSDAGGFLSRPATLAQTHRRWTKFRRPTRCRCWLTTGRRKTSSSRNTATGRKSPMAAVTRSCPDRLL
jgi:hypothetical protein